MTEQSNKVLTRTEMRERAIDTSDFMFMDEAGFFFGELVLKAEARGGMLRLFFNLEDGRKIITPVFWWQQYLGFYEMNNHTFLRLQYERNSQGGIYLKKAEIADAEEEKSISFSAGIQEKVSNFLED